MNIVICNDKCSNVTRIISSVMKPIMIAFIIRINLNCNAIVYDSVMMRKVAYDNGVKVRFNHNGIPSILVQLVFVIFD